MREGAADFAAAATDRVLRPTEAAGAAGAKGESGASAVVAGPPALARKDDVRSKVAESGAPESAVGG